MLECVTAEFDIYAALAFSLHVPLCEFELHFHRLLKAVESHPAKYLGPRVHATYFYALATEAAWLARDPCSNGIVSSLDKDESSSGLLTSLASSKSGVTTPRSTALELPSALSETTTEDVEESQTRPTPHPLVTPKTAFQSKAISFSQWWQEVRTKN